MKYSELTRTYERLESTQSKLEKADILAELFRKANDRDLPKLVLLASGRVFPSYSKEVIGIASKLMVKAIAKAAGFSLKEVEGKFKETGDLGLTAAYFVGSRKQQTLFKKDLDTDKVFENLRKLPGITGLRSQEKKMNLIAELFASAGPKESVYITRTILEEMRVGVARGIIRDSIVKAFLEPEDKEKKKELTEAVEYAFNITSDFSRVIVIAKEKGEKGLKSVKVHPGRPHHLMLGEKAESIKEITDKFGKVAVEYKYDGMRCVSGFTYIYVKNKGMFPVRDVKVGDEVLTHKGRFRKVIAKNKRKLDKGEKIFRFSTYLGNEFKITEGHEILVNTKSKIKWVPVEKVPKGAEAVFSIPRIKNKEKVPNKMVLSTIGNYKKEIKLNEDFFRFMGCWVGDGYSNEYNNTHRLGIVFNQNKRKKIEYYKNIIIKKLGILKDKVSEHTHNGGTSVYWTDTPLLKWISANFRKEGGKGCRDKKLPSWFWNISENQFKAFLKGWKDADGYEDKTGIASIMTKEKQLASLTQLIALKFGIILGVRKVRVNDKNYYKIIFTKSSKHARIKNNTLFVRILKKEKIKYPDPRTIVYNLQVKDDESYCTTIASLHNCEIHKKNDKIWVFTRRLDDVSRQFPDLVELCKKGLKPAECVVEGEVLSVDEKGYPKPFQSLSQRIQRKYDIKEIVKKIPIQINLFDITYLNGKMLFDKTFSERRRLLEKSVKSREGKLQLARQIVTDDPKKAGKFYKEALKARQEGVFLKVPGSKYVFGRHVNGWYKIKPIMETLDLVIVAATWGEGKRSKWLSSYVLACRDPDTDEFLPCGMMGTGLTEEMFQTMTDTLEPMVTEEKGKNVKVRPKVVVEVAYQEIQKSPTYRAGYALRFPRLLKIREDKGPEEADTLERLEKLYKTQGRGG